MISLRSLWLNTAPHVLRALCSVWARTQFASRALRSAVSWNAGQASRPSVTQRALQALSIAAGFKAGFALAPSLAGVRIRSAHRACLPFLFQDRASFIPLFSPARPVYNWSLDTDPQLQEAASPQVLWSGQLQRYAARRLG
jgi:hypothetical protein